MQTGIGTGAGLDAVAVTIQVWQQAHPRATLTEIERELDRQWRGVRATWLAQLVEDTSGAVGDCPDCGVGLVRRGRHARVLDTDGGVPITLQRTYASCPVCGRGLFPPG